MDANNTRFHLLLGKADWTNCLADSGLALLDVDDACGSGAPALELRAGDPASETYWDDAAHELTLKPLVFLHAAAPRDVPLKLDDRRGAACDRFGSWYWINRSRREIRIRSAGSGAVTRFWSVEQGVAQPPQAEPGDFRPRVMDAPAAPSLLSGLTITVDHYLVVGTLQPAGLLIFDLYAGGAPQHLLWPETVPFAPFDFAPRPKGGVWILDRDNKCYWALGPHFDIVDARQQTVAPAAETVDVFQPKTGGKPRRLSRSFPANNGAAVALPDLDPVAIEALPDDTVLLLDNQGVSYEPDTEGQLPIGFSRLVRYRFGQRLGEPVSIDVVTALLDPDQPVRLVGHDFVFVAEHPLADDPCRLAPNRLVIATDGGNQCLAFALSVQDEQLVMIPQREYLPMRLCGGRGLGVFGDRAFYDFGDGDGARWLPLVEQSRPRYAEQAILVTPVFDGREPDCVWHRLMLDARIPPEASVTVCSRTGHDRRSVENASWHAEPSLLLRPDGSEQPYARGPQTAPLAGEGTWELLFQQARGQFLQLRLVLRGDGRTTPRLRGLRAYYPRFSYLAHYLPAVYREDVRSASFLDRFLANFEGAYTTLEDKIAAVQVLFDVRSVPEDALDWLASWFEIALDPGWDEERRRLFIANAMEFFQMRGTLPGLLAALRLTLDDFVDASIFSPQPAHPRSIRIAETFRTRQGDVESTPIAGLVAMRATAHRFTVQLPVTSSTELNTGALQRRIDLVKRLVDLEKPAHTIYDIQLYWAMFRVGEGRLGEDSLIAQGSRAPQLMPPLVLDQGYLAEGRLEAGYPQNVADRPIVTGTSRIR